MTTLDPTDTDRLKYQRERLMSHADGVWRSLRQWNEIAGGLETSTSMRLRELKLKYGYVKETKNQGGGLWMTRILPPPNPVQTFQYEPNGQAVFL